MSNPGFQLEDIVDYVKRIICAEEAPIHRTIFQCTLYSSVHVMTIPLALGRSLPNKFNLTGRKRGDEKLTYISSILLSHEKHEKQSCHFFTSTLLSGCGQMIERIDSAIL